MPKGTRSTRIMQVNLPPKVRAALYIITVVGTPIITVLVSQNVVGDLWGQLWAAFVTGVGALAAFNVTK